jgi:hypothetical protein
MSAIDFFLAVLNVSTTTESGTDDGLWHDDSFFSGDDGLWHDDAYFVEDDGLWHDDIYF